MGTENDPKEYFIVVDPRAGRHVIAAVVDGIWCPAVSPRRQDIERLLPSIRRSGLPFKVIHFTAAEDVTEEFAAAGGSAPLAESRN